MTGRARSWRLGEIAEWVGGSLEGPADLELDGPTSAESPDPRGIAFVQDAKFLALAEENGVGAVLAPPGFETKLPAIRVENPKVAFGILLARAVRPIHLQPGIHPTAVVAENASVDPTAQIGAYAVVEGGARIGAGCRVYPFAYIGEGCELGAGCMIFPHAVLVQDVRLGEGTIIQSGAVLGADGFGYYWDGKRHVKIPQVGGVHLGDHCEIGALTTVDRATAGDTRVGNGTKLDNLVMVAHNVTIGEHTVVASQTGIAGSSKVGNRVTMAGQCAVGDHKVVGDDIIFAGQTGAAQDVTEPGIYFGMPARPMRETQRRMLLQMKLPELFDRVKALEKKLEEAA